MQLHSKRRSVCIAQDGLPVFDDVGNIHGYAAFRRSISRASSIPFFRVDKSRSREYGGAGLGLSLVWEIADLHGGSVWVEESSEKGTTIAVELPVH